MQTILLDKNDNNNNEKSEIRSGNRQIVINKQVIAKIKLVKSGK